MKLLDQFKKKPHMQLVIDLWKKSVNEALNIKVGEGRILRIMKGNNLLSHVRVKKWIPFQYKRRKEMKVGKLKDLLKQNFFCVTPRKKECYWYYLSILLRKDVLLEYYYGFI